MLLVSTSKRVLYRHISGDRQAIHGGRFVSPLQGGVLCGRRGRLAGNRGPLGAGAPGGEPGAPLRGSFRVAPPAETSTSDAAPPIAARRTRERRLPRALPPSAGRICDSGRCVKGGGGVGISGARGWLFPSSVGAVTFGDRWSRAPCAVIKSLSSTALQGNSERRLRSRSAA